MKRHFRDSSPPHIPTRQVHGGPTAAPLGETAEPTADGRSTSAKFVGCHEETVRRAYLARAPHLHALRRAGAAAFIRADVPRLDPSRRTYQGLVARKEQTT